VLGLENGDRPPLNFPGYWLYSGGVATCAPDGPAPAARRHRYPRHRKEVSDTNRLDHIAFAPPTPTKIRQRLQAKNVKFASRSCHARGIRSFFCMIRMGWALELNFPKR